MIKIIPTRNDDFGGFDVQFGCIEKAERNANGGGDGGGDGWGRRVACNQSLMAIKFSADGRETAAFVLTRENSLTVCQRVSLLFSAISFSIREMLSISPYKGEECVYVCTLLAFHNSKCANAKVQRN